MLSLLVLIGHLIAAGLASHRSNPLHSFDGSFRSILILEIAAVMLAPLACARTLPDTKPLNRWHTLPVLLYAALTVLASFFGYARYIQAINFSLKWAHLKAPAAGVLLTLLTASALVSVLLALHLIEAARRKQLYGYAGALLSAVGGIALVSLLLAPRYYLHIHHSVWSLFLVFLFRYEKWSSIFLFFRKILSTSNRRIFRVSKGGAFSLLEKFSGRNWNFILPQKEFEHRENGRKEIRTSDLYS